VYRKPAPAFGSTGSALTLPLRASIPISITASLR
jgi:hypothetical protein